MKRCVLALLILMSPGASMAFRATLHTVFDGDTIDVLDENGRSVRVRLSGIDAPERGQPFGQKARDSLQRLVSAGVLEVDPHSIDRYQRVLAKVTCGGHDVSFEQIRSGSAWFYPWTDSISQSDRFAYLREEQAARASHRGLWTDRDAVPPWQFRRAEAGSWPSSFTTAHPAVAAQTFASPPGVVVLPPDARPALNSGSAKPITRKAARHPGTQKK